MKIVILIIIGLGFILPECQAQRKLPEQKGLQLNAGFNDGYSFNRKKNISYYTSFCLFSYTPNSHAWLYGIEYWEKRYCYKSRSIPVSQFSLESGYYYNFLSDRRKNVFFSIGVSGLAGYETIHWGKKVVSDGARIENRNKFIAGGTLTIEVETFVTDYLSFVINGRERFTTSDVGKWHFQTGIGIRYIYK